MQTWVLVSEIVRNFGLALAAFGGVILAWWKLAPERTQAGSVAGRIPPRVNLRGAFIRNTDWSNSNLREGDLSEADLTGASFRNAIFEGTHLSGTILKGADLTGAVNLTVEQLAAAVIDEHTKLPAYIDRARLLDESKTRQHPADAIS